ncbi:MAG: hypothetical protein CL532_09020 [Aestuariivita sp.]|nr:hypothetical protein [Aestuariivita sp.]|tara:strand:+ start:123 stop:428 length:306 start_codon:yes stop_codon:yes gene_type:complete
MQEPDDSEKNVPNLTFLRRLVTLLTLTMIVGIAALVTLIFIRFQGEATPMSLPDSISLPDGARPMAFTKTHKWYAIITEDDEIMFFDTNGVLFNRVKVFSP